MKLTSMKVKKRDKEKTLGMMSPSAVGDGDQYPYGLRIRLENEQLDKLGFKDMPKVGDYLTIEAECCVISTSQNTNQGGDERRNLELQIEKIGCEEDDDGDDVAAVSKGVKKADDDYA
ncbi:MAG TPA: hypothetical protein VE907_06275 [Gammaproteobacteria bacterium]|nr:hypothetical protein [Gammaproteobacteria bacterium]